jgi:hypothetical protein
MNHWHAKHNQMICEGIENETNDINMTYKHDPVESSLHIYTKWKMKMCHICIEWQVATHCKLERMINEMVGTISLNFMVYYWMADLSFLRQVSSS